MKSLVKTLKIIDGKIGNEKMKQEIQEITNKISDLYKENEKLSQSRKKCFLKKIGYLFIFLGMMILLKPLYGSNSKV